MKILEKKREFFKRENLEREICKRDKSKKGEEMRF